MRLARRVLGHAPERGQRLVRRARGHARAHPAASSAPHPSRPGRLTPVTHPGLFLLCCPLPALRPPAHVQYFDSAADLATKLASADFRAISARMRRHSAEMQPIMRQKWRTVLGKLFHGLPSGSWPTGPAGGFDAALEERFGLRLDPGDPDCARLSAPDLGQWN